MHEWTYSKGQEAETSVNELGEVYLSQKEAINNLVTWVYQENSFVPSAKIQGEEQFSIISDYIGRPVQCYSENGSLVWSTDYDIYGGLRELKGEKSFIPFRQLGQYEDLELEGLYYNRFRYYDCSIGNYISQDPIGLLGNNPTFYGYVHDSNSWIDPFGLKKRDCTPSKLNMTNDGVDHVLDRHWGNHPDWTHKSKWNGNRSEWKTKSRETFKNPDRVSRDGDRYIFEKEFKTPIGKDAQGNDLYYSRVVTESNGDLVTAFPQTIWK